MGKRLEYTPNSQIKSALRRLFLRSRERASRLKMDGYTCQRCGVKQSRKKGAAVKVEVHHVENINWLDIIAYIRKTLLVDPEKMTTRCIPCHKKEHKEEKS